MKQQTPPEEIWMRATALKVLLEMIDHYSLDKQMFTTIVKKDKCITKKIINKLYKYDFSYIIDVLDYNQIVKTTVMLMVYNLGYTSVEH